MSSCLRHLPKHNSPHHYCTHKHYSRIGLAKRLFYTAHIRASHVNLEWHSSRSRQASCAWTRRCTHTQSDTDPSPPDLWESLMHSESGGDQNQRTFVSTSQAPVQKSQVEQLLETANPRRLTQLPPGSVDQLREVRDPQLVESVLFDSCWAISPVPSYYSSGDVQRYLSRYLQFKRGDKPVVHRSFIFKNTFYAYLGKMPLKNFRQYRKDETKALDRGHSLDLHIKELKNMELVLKEIRMATAFEVDRSSDNMVLLHVRIDENAALQEATTSLNQHNVSNTLTLDEFRRSTTVTQLRPTERSVAMSMIPLMDGRKPHVRMILSQPTETAMSNRLSNQYSVLNNTFRFIVYAQRPEEAWTILSRLTLQPLTITNGAGEVIGEVVHAEKW